MKNLNLKIIFRHLSKHLSLVSINVIGLSISIAAFILIFIYVKKEISYDKSTSNYENIYRLEVGNWCVLPAGFGHYITNQISGLDKVVRFSMNENTLTKYKNKNYIIKDLAYADSTVLDVFNFELIVGDQETALSDYYSIIISEKIADELFDNKNPVGEVIEISNQHKFKVTGIFKEITDFHIAIDAIGSFNTLGKMYGEGFLTILDDGYQHPTYLLLNENKNKEEVEDGINDIMINTLQVFDSAYFKLRPLKDIYFSEEPIIGEKYRKQGSKKTISILSMVAVLIILIACINFINLTTAKSSVRSKEIGIKKVLGSSRKRIIIQILLETFFICFISLLLAFILAEMVKPYFTNIIQEDLYIKSIYSVKIILLFLVGIIAITLLSGIFPSVYIASFSTIKVLKGELIKGEKAQWLRKILTILQFSISIALIVATLVIYLQVSYMKNQDLGFKKENVITLNLNRTLENKIEFFKNEIRKDPNMINVTLSCAVPGESGWTFSLLINNIYKSVKVNSIDPEFLDTYNLTLLEGRNLDRNRSEADQDNKFILNEAALELFNIENAIGTRIENIPNGNGIGEIVGVIKDFHFQSLRNNIEPMMFYWKDWAHRKVSISFNATSGEEISNILDYVESCWKQTCPDNPFEYTFIDQSFDQLYNKEERLANIFLGFSILTVIIACLGILGLSSFIAERKTKEIGIRKVHGATFRKIFTLLFKDITLTIIISGVIASVFSVYFMQQWLNNFAYRISFPVWTLALSALLAIIVTVITIGYQTAKTARLNPVESLRYE